MITLLNQYQFYKFSFLIIELLWATKALLLPSFYLTSCFPNPPPPTTRIPIFQMNQIDLLGFFFY
jgi:hypothetical protein